MKTTLNLGNFSFNFNEMLNRGLSSDEYTAQKPTTTAVIEIKEVSITFEASVEETLADIKGTVEVVKEMKNLASEFGNLFAQYTAKQQDISVANQKKEAFEQRFNEMKASIDATTETVMEEMKAFDKKVDTVENNIATLTHKVYGDKE